MRKNPVTSQLNSIINHQTTNLLQLESNLKKKCWLWTPLVVTLVIIMLSIGFQFNTITFIFAPLLSLSMGYWLFSVRCLVICARFLKPKIKNKPTSCLKHKSISPALKITRRCLYQFCFANSFIFFAAIAFSANESGDLFNDLFYNLALMLIFSGVIYGISLLISHAYLITVLSHPVLRYLRAFRLAKSVYLPECDFPIRNDVDAPDGSLTAHKIQEDILESWMHDPINPASAEHQSSIWNKHP